LEEGRFGETTNKARSHTYTQAQATQPLHRGPPSRIPTAFQHRAKRPRRGGGWLPPGGGSPGKREWRAPSGSGRGTASGTAAVAARGRLPQLGRSGASAGGLRYVPPPAGGPPRTATTTLAVPIAGSATPSPSLPSRTLRSTTPLDQRRAPGGAPVVRKTAWRRRGAAPLAGGDARRAGARRSSRPAVAGGAVGASGTAGWAARGAWAAWAA